MTSMQFDTLDYAERLVAAGESREVAAVHAQTMKSALVTFSDDLVTKDYLDTRFGEFEARIDAKLDRRFGDFRVEIEQRFSALDTRLGRLETKLNMTNAIVLAAVAVPQVANVALKLL